MASHWNWTRGCLLLAVLGPAAVCAAPIDDLKVENAEAADGAFAAPTSTGSFDLVGDPADSPSVAALRAFQQGNIDVCLAHLRSAVAKDPTLPPPKLILAGLHQKAGNLRAARKLLEEVAASGTEDPELYLTLAKIATAEGRFTEALLSFDKMEALTPQTTLSEERKARMAATILRGRATVAQRRGNWEKAQALLSKLVEINPTQADLRDRWAVALLRAGRAQKAFEQFDIAYQQNSKLNRPEISMGVVLIQQGKLEQAQQWYQKAVSAYPNDAAVHTAAAVALMFQDRAAEAERHAAKAASLGSDSIKLRVIRGMIARQLKKLDDAEAHFSRVLETSPDHTEAAYQLMMTLAASSDGGRKQRALELAKEFAAKQSQSPPILTALGAAYYANGDLDRAEETLRNLAQRSDAEPRTLYVFGRVLTLQGKEDEARQVAARLSSSLDRPMLFVMRPAARRWIQENAP